MVKVVRRHETPVRRLHPRDCHKGDRTLLSAFGSGGDGPAPLSLARHIHFEIAPEIRLGARINPAESCQTREQEGRFMGLFTVVAAVEIT